MFGFLTIGTDFCLVSFCFFLLSFFPKELLEAKTDVLICVIFSIANVDGL